MIHVVLLAVILGTLNAQLVPAPVCAALPGRRAERIQGEVVRGATFNTTTPAGWMLRLVPGQQGWFLEVTQKGREMDDLSRLTPPWHFVPNARELEGWHFRNADNSGPTDGSVNAPQELREFIFSPVVGRGIEYNGSATTPEDVAKVEAFGRGWLHLDEFRLTPPRQGERAAFEWLRFTACLTWPAG
jgi:hypothetical protein